MSHLEKKHKEKKEDIRRHRPCGRSTYPESLINGDVKTNEIWLTFRNNLVSFLGCLATRKNRYAHPFIIPRKIIIFFFIPIKYILTSVPASSHVVVNKRCSFTSFLITQVLKTNHTYLVRHFI